MLVSLERAYPSMVIMHNKAKTDRSYTLCVPSRRDFSWSTSSDALTTISLKEIEIVKNLETSTALKPSQGDGSHLTRKLTPSIRNRSLSPVVIDKEPQIPSSDTVQDTISLPSDKSAPPTEVARPDVERLENSGINIYDEDSKWNSKTGAYTGDDRPFLRRWHLRLNSAGKFTAVPANEKSASSAGQKVKSQEHKGKEKQSVGGTSKAGVCSNQNSGSRTPTKAANLLTPFDNTGSDDSLLVKDYQFRVDAVIGTLPGNVHVEDNEVAGIPADVRVTLKPSPPGIHDYSYGYVARLHYANESGSYWDLAIRLLQSWDLYPTNLTEHEFVQMVCRHDPGEWVAENARWITFRALRQWVRANDLLRAANIKSSDLNSSFLDAFEWMAEDQQKFFIRSYKQLEFQVNASKRGIPFSEHEMDNFSCLSDVEQCSIFQQRRRHITNQKGSEFSLRDPAVKSKNSMGTTMGISIFSRNASTDSGFPDLEDSSTQLLDFELGMKSYNWARAFHNMPADISPPPKEPAEQPEDKALSLMCDDLDTLVWDEAGHEERQAHSAPNRFADPKSEPVPHLDPRQDFEDQIPESVVAVDGDSTMDKMPLGLQDLLISRCGSFSTTTATDIDSLMPDISRQRKVKIEADNNPSIGGNDLPPVVHVETLSANGHGLTEEKADDFAPSQEQPSLLKVSEKYRDNNPKRRTLRKKMNYVWGSVKGSVKVSFGKSKSRPHIKDFF